MHRARQGTRHAGLVIQHRGLTLIEVLAVVVILGMLAGILVVSFGGQMGKARRELAKTGIGVVVGALEGYALDNNGAYPTMQQGLEVLTQKPPGRNEPYLKPDKLIDPWGEPYKYEVPGPNGAYLVLSYGSDKQAGGEAGSDAADITSDNLRDDTQGPS